MKRVATVLIVLLLMVGCLLGGYVAGDKGLLSSTQILDSNNVNQSIKEVEALIRTYFYEDVEDEALQEGMLKGMAALLGDPYSMYLTADEYERYTASTTSKYAGVGILMGYDEEGQIIIKEVYEGGSAKEQGIQPGDIIKKANEYEVTEESQLSDVSGELKGDPGTTADIELERNGKTIKLTLERRELTINHVTSRMLEGDIGYIKIGEFSGDATEHFLEEAIELTSNGAKGLIIDVRGNPGGFVMDAVNIADALLPEGLIVYTEDKNGKRTDYESDAEALDMPMVMLIDGDSASASEILVGAMQDHKAADIVGTQSYGKGIVQKPFEVGSTGGALILTISTYYTPNGRSIHGEGIEPDYVVELPEKVQSGEEELTDENDTQLKKGMELIQDQLGTDEKKAA